MAVLQGNRPTSRCEEAHVNHLKGPEESNRKHLCSREPCGCAEAEAQQLGDSEVPELASDRSPIPPSNYVFGHDYHGSLRAWALVLQTPISRERLTELYLSGPQALGKSRKCHI